MAVAWRSRWRSRSPSATLRGWLGVARRPITASKLAGLALLALGTGLIVRD